MNGTPDQSAENTTQSPALQELRAIVYALAAFVFLVSVALNIFVYKQNRRVQLELENAARQISAIEGNQVLLQNKAAMENLLKEVAAQLPSHPEVQQILGAYGLSVVQQGSPPAPAASALPAAK